MSKNLYAKINYFIDGAPRYDSLYFLELNTNKDGYEFTIDEDGSRVYFNHDEHTDLQICVLKG